jgi:hypothetical protein
VTSAEIVVFLGPSLPVDEARRVLDARYLSPVRCGDVLRVRRLKPRVIAIIDGLFESISAVWHKEILLALEDGVAVYGASSMGALRAAELQPFGMIGIGKIFEAYRDGCYTDDDEVALLHGPDGLRHNPVSEAMVNIRATVAHAVGAGVIGSAAGERVIACAKETFYQERSFDRAIAQAWDAAPESEEAARFRRFIEEGGYVNQKRLDALALLRHLAEMHSTPRPGLREAVHRSSFILRLQHDVMSGPFVTRDADLPRDEQVALACASTGTRYVRLRRLAQLMALACALARAQGLTSTPERRARVFEQDDFGLGPTARTRRWADARDLTEDTHASFVERLSVVRALIDAFVQRRGTREARRRYEARQLDLMRIDGAYASDRPRAGGRGAAVDRAVLRNAARRDPVDFGLDRRTSTLWCVLDDVAGERGFSPPERAQVLSDRFRLARGLDRRAATVEWMRASNLTHARYVTLVEKEAVLSALCSGREPHALELMHLADPACWLLDAIRLTGLYPAIRRRLTRDDRMRAARARLC